MGSFVKFTAHIVYTQGKYMQVAVLAEIFDGKSRQNITMSVFHYTYETTDESPVEVIPKTYQDTLWYLEGRRKFNFVMESTDTINESCSF